MRAFILFGLFLMVGKEKIAFWFADIVIRSLGYYFVIMLSNALYWRLECFDCGRSRCFGMRKTAFVCSRWDPSFGFCCLMFGRLF